MHVEEANEIHIFEKLSVAEQVLYSVETLTHLKESKQFKEIKGHMIIGSLLADLLLLNKLDLTNDKISITDGTGSTNFGYLDNFITDLQSKYSGSSVEDVLTGFQKYENLEDKIRDDLFKKNLLEGKKKKFEVKNTVLLRRNMYSIGLALRENSDPANKLLYHIALLESIGFLQNFFKSSDEFKEKEQRLFELLKDHPKVKLIYDTIKSINPEQDDKEIQEFARQTQLFQ